MTLLGSLWERVLAASELITLLLCFWLMIWLAERRAPRHGLSAATIGNLTFSLGLGALVGARLVHILPDWQTYLRYPLDFILVQSGLSFWGGLLGGVVALLLMKPPSVPLRAGGGGKPPLSEGEGRGEGLEVRSKAEDPHPNPLPGGEGTRGGASAALSRPRFVALVADAFALPLCVGIIAYSLACVVRGDCAGAVGTPPLAFVLPGYAQPRYPVELYVALLTAALGGILLYVEPRRRFVGEMALLCLVGLGLIRFATDFMRIHFGVWPTLDQLIALVVAVGAGSAWLVLRSRTPGVTSERG